MKNILLLQQKGGTGKSTIVSELVRSLQRTGTPSAYYDLDQQGGGLFKPYKDDGAVVSVIDTPGQLSENAGKWVKESDVIVVPTLCSKRDMEPLERTLKIVRKNRKRKSKIVIVLNRFTRWKSSTDFMDWIQRQDTKADMILTMPQSELFLQANADDKAIIDFKPRSEPAKATLKVVNAIRSAAGLDEEII